MNLRDMTLEYTDERFDEEEGFCIDRYYYSFGATGQDDKLLVSERQLHEGDIDEHVTPANGVNIPKDELEFTPSTIFERVLPVPQDEITAEDLKNTPDIWEDVLKGHYHVDPILLKLFSSLFFKRERAHPELTKYSPHIFLYTNPKTGKTSMGQRFGDVMTRPSVSALMGFATSDTISPSQVDSTSTPIVVDEIQEEKTKGTHDQLLKLLEQGVVNVARGHKRVHTEIYAPLVYVGNPKVHEDSDDDRVLTFEYTDAVQKVSTNYRAFSSRMALIIFGMDFDECRYRGWTRERSLEKLQAWCESVRELCEKPFTDFLQLDKVQSWLERPHPEEYRNELSEFEDEKLLEESVMGLQENHRHMRGTALRLALLDHVPELLTGEPDVDEVLEEAESEYEELLDVQSRSFEELADNLDFSWLLQRHFENGSELEKTFISAVVSNNEKIFALEDLDLEFHPTYSAAHLKERLRMNQLEKFRMKSLGEKDVYECRALGDLKNQVGELVDEYVQECLDKKERGG